MYPSCQIPCDIGKPRALVCYGEILTGPQASRASSLGKRRSPLIQAHAG